MTVPSDHSHFINFGGKGKCKLYDDAKIEEQVDRAEKETVRSLLRTVPGLKPSELKI
jgi:hypothetical protein